MSTNIDLKKIERKVWMRYYEDGLFDIYMGLLLLVMGLGPESARFNIPVGWVAAVGIGLTVLAMGSLYLAKRLITYPRIGRVKFGPKGKARKMKTTILFSISALILLAVFVVMLLVSGRRVEIPNLLIIFPTVYAVYVLVIFGLAAYFLEYSRLYVVGFMYALPFPLLILIDNLVGVDLGYLTTAVPALVILIMGAVVLTRFIREHPIPAMTQPVEEGVDGR